MLQIYVTMSRIHLKHIIFKNYIYMKREKKTIVRANNSFKLWMINTWVTHIKIKSFSNLRYHGNIRDFK